MSVFNSAGVSSCFFVPAFSNISSALCQEAEIEFFEKKIRPVLVERCYKCHSVDSKKVERKLFLDTREGLLTGGESGPAIIVGKPEKSLLISALQYEDLEMPPKNKLPDTVINDFILWIKNGETDPRDGKTRKVDSGIDVEKACGQWPYSPLSQTVPPSVEGSDGEVSAIDRYILAGLKTRGLSPAKPTNPRSLIRRLHFDLIGLPPVAETVEKFTSNPSPENYEELVEKLLNSPHFGERWGRHWLDIARYPGHRECLALSRLRHPGTQRRQTL